MIIVVDTREQKPLRFKGYRTVKRKLDVGDYSVKGHERRVAVERKSLGDYFHSFTGSRREPMFRKIARMGRMRSAALVVEATPAVLLQGSGYSSVSPARLLGTVMAQCAGAGVQLIFADDADTAAECTLRVLLAYMAGAGDSALARRQRAVYTRRTSS